MDLALACLSSDHGDGLGKISQARLIRGRFFTINAIPAEAA